MSTFGFSTEPTAGGDFTPVLKYDARAGRFFRMDRVDSGNGFTNEPIDVTQGISFIADFENVEVGWINFPVGSAPDFKLVPLGTTLPDRPSTQHKNGLRFMLKLAKNCGGDKPVREIAGTSKAFLSGIEQVYLQYKADKEKFAGKLPVLAVERIVPVKSGSGVQTSTNYHPTFVIVGWIPRGDLVFVPKASVPSTAQQALKDTLTPPSTEQQVPKDTATAPSTGSTRAEPPKQTELADDFG